MPRSYRAYFLVKRQKRGVFVVGEQKTISKCLLCHHLYFGTRYNTRFYVQEKSIFHRIQTPSTQIFCVNVSKDLTFVCVESSKICLCTQTLSLSLFSGVFDKCFRWCVCKAQPVRHPLNDYDETGISYVHRFDLFEPNEKNTDAVVEWPLWTCEISFKNKWFFSILSDQRPQTFDRSENFNKRWNSFLDTTYPVQRFQECCGSTVAGAPG